MALKSNLYYLICVCGLFGVLLTVAPATAQKKSEILIFNEAWVWEYRNEMINESEPGHTGEMVAYHNPKTGYWLFSSEAYGISGEMMDWVMAKPDGTYIARYTDEFGKKKTVIEKLNFINPAELPDYYIPTGKFEWFGDHRLGFARVKAWQHEIAFSKSGDKSKIFLADAKSNMLPLYFFNQLNAEAKLPIHFPIELPANKLAVSEVTQMTGKKVSYSFRYVSHAVYEISLY